MAFGAVMAAAMTSPALAQDTGSGQAPAEAVGGGSTGEIVVTAQRREQTLQKVPVAVSTVNAAQIEARRLNNLDQISGIAPNLVVAVGNNAVSSTQVAIRGSITTNNTINYDPAVGLYLDGVYVGKATGSVFDLGDLERLEVLRGPQGTLFGRNTLAGAISFVTRKPSDQFRVEGEMSYGNYDYAAGRGLVNLPLTDHLYVKVAGQFQRRDGFMRLVPDPLGAFPTAKGDEDDRNRYSVMAQVRWEPNSRLTIDYSYDLSHIDEHPSANLFAVGTNPLYDQLKTATGFGSGNIFDPASPYYSGIPLYAYVVQGDERPKTLSSDVRNTDRSRVYGHALTIDYDIGFGTLKSITAYRNVFNTQHVFGQDPDGAPPPVALGGFIAHYDQFSQELQLTGNLFDDRLNYVVGGYYFRDNAQLDNPQSYFFGATNLETRLGLRSRAYAAYAQADYKLTDRLTVTGGLRWTSERKQVNRLYQVIDSDGAHFDPPLTVIDITKADDVHHTFSNVSPAAIVAYQFTDDLNVYAKYSVGFRSGSYNADAGPSNDPLDPEADVRSFFRPEKNKSAEVGVKSRFFDRRLTINFAAFYNTEVDKQVASFQGKQAASTINRNAGKGRVKGLEVEVDARPIDVLHLYGSLGLLRTHFIQYIDTAQDGSLVDVADNRYYPRAPRTTASAGADFEFYRADDLGRFTLSGDMVYQGRTFALPGAYSFDPRFPLVATADQYLIPQHTLVNARLRWDDIPLNGNGLHGYVMVWAKNLTDMTKVSNKIVFGPNFGGLVDANYYEPRTYGVTFGFKY